MRFLIIGICLIIIILLLLFAACLPRTSELARCAAFMHLDFAHRGLHSKEEQIPENSLLAFKRAVKCGIPIELDVHLTKDKRAVVFHDDSLKRMCGIDANIWTKTYEELSRLRLADTAERIPLFSDVLKVVDGKVPLLIELKVPRKGTLICVVVNELLRKYNGSYLIQTFNPVALHWYREHNPDILRGQLSDHFSGKVQHSPILLFLAENLLFNWYTKPDFISYEYRYGIRCLPLILLRFCFKTPAFGWTIRNPEIYSHYKEEYDSLIFEHFIPARRTD